ncbi:MAG: response regulator [Verrucomicrobiales bacterium]|nr:response regulator [Verrucomicrobiales bacterium]
MSSVTSQAILSLLFRDLGPAADKLAQLIRELAETIPQEELKGQIANDIAKLNEEAAGFQTDVKEWCGEPFKGEKDEFEAYMRHSRHEVRNRLNHLFGVIQLVQMMPPSPAFAEKCVEIVGSLETCLSFVAGTSKAAKEAASKAEQEPHVLPPPCEPGETRGRLLIADDDEENRLILDRLLSPCGFEIVFAVNGREAIKEMEAHDFDAVLLDIEMPEMNGFEVLESLRASGHLRHTPVIVVTGLQEETDAVRCIEIGAEDFLSRPIRPALLMARLNASLEKKKLREKVFEQHFTPELARELARNPDPMKMQARQAEVSVLFCDIRGFSTISERLGPSQTIDWLSGVMGEFSTIVIELGGVLVDYTGDELMALWGAPNRQPNHAELACRAALDIMASLPKLNAQWEELVGAETSVGIGVNTGEALVGNVGTHRKFKYGPLGTAVNLASRVQGATKYLKTSLLITGETASQLPDSFGKRRLCQVVVKNIRKPVNLVELEPPGSSEDWQELATKYEEALLQFEESNFRRASSILSDCLMSTPNDGPSLQLMSRVVDAMLNDGKDFTPTWTLPGK